MRLWWYGARMSHIAAKQPAALAATDHDSARRSIGSRTRPETRDDPSVTAAVQAAPPTAFADALGAILARSVADRASTARPQFRQLADPRAGSDEAQRSRHRLGRPGALQRKVKIGGPKKPWLAKGALPPIPPEIAARYQQYVIDQVKELAEAQRADTVTAGREFATAAAFYQPLFDQVITAANPAAARDGRAAWTLLKFAVAKQGHLTEVPWSTFSATEAATLERDLAACPVQVSDNTATTACHGNAHQKLPKKVVVPGGGLLAHKPEAEQFDLTPYIEFLIAGGQKKATGIERGILDKDSGQIYVTAHYTQGSFAWLSGAPQALVDNWQAKAQKYGRVLKGTSTPDDWL